MVLHLLNVFQDALMQLDKDERLAKLEETFDSVCEDYKRILAMAL
jgi:histone acetyltransferase 1